MTGSDEPKPVGKTRWRRVPLVLVPVYAMIAGLLILAASGTLGVSFAISGTDLTVTADSLTSGATDGNGVGLYQFGIVNFTGNSTPTPVPQFETIVPNATLVNLCQSVSVGPLTLRTSAGTTPGSPVTATNLIVDAKSLSAGTASFTNIKIGQDMGTFTNPALTEPVARGSGPNVTTANVPTGTFGQVASGASITGGLRQVANATSAGNFTLPNLSITFGAPC